MLTLDKIYHASYVLKDVIRRTDLIAAPLINPEANVYLKPENLQFTGSFKVRGSYYKISQLSPEEKEKGVIACSAGNHAQGVAMAATKNGIHSIICLPDCAPLSKIEATRGFGAEICLVEGVYDDAYRKALELRDEKGYTFIHPFNDPEVIAGQGTIALELLEQLPELDVVLVPIGGGGLISGIAYTIKTLNPHVKVYGVQAMGAPSMKNSVEHGKMLSAALTMQGIKNGHVFGDMDPVERRTIISRFKDEQDDLNILINYEVLTTGFDATNIECVFIARPTQSVVLYSQMLGRGLRGPQMGGKATCLLIDVKDNLKQYDENMAFSHFDSYWNL